MAGSFSDPGIRKQRINKLVGIEVLEIINALAYANETDGYSELPAKGKNDASLGRAIQLGQRNAGQPHGFPKPSGPTAGAIRF